MRIRTTLALLVTIAAAGCQCKGPNTETRLGELVVVWTNESGAVVENRDALYDFGQAIIGQTRQQTLVVKNTGQRSLSLVNLAHQSGDVTAVPSLSDNAPAPFSVAFQTVEIGPAQQAEFAMLFAPKELKKNYESKILLTADNALEPTALITLKGGGEAGDCNVPDVIDFGATPVGETYSYPIELKNPSTVTASANVGDISGTDAAAFGFAAGSAQGRVEVSPMSTATIRFTFKPTEKRAYSAQVSISGVGECPSKTVTIRGDGSDQTLSWRPTDIIKFGYVNPTDEGMQDLTFINPSGGQVQITDITTSDPAIFYQAVQAGQNASTFTVNGGGETKMKLACRPPMIGKYTGTLTFRTGLTNPAMGSLALECNGGGPRIRVAPRPNVSFGRVGYFPGSTTFSVSRKVTISNVGTRPQTPTTDANLHLGSIRIDGTPGEMPYLELTPRMGLTADELTVTLGSPYNAATGLEATPGNFVDLLVTLRPQSVGRKEAELVIYSNDTTDREVRLSITAEAQELPPCRYSISPATANFGLVTPGSQKDLPITITNLGMGANDVCYLSGIDLRAGSNPAYSIVGGPVVEKELRPGESFVVTVRINPPGPVPTTLVSMTGELQFNATSPTEPQGRVPLMASVGPSCLVVTPDPLDFGVVKVGCNSSSKSLSLYNSCSRDIFVQGFTMQSAAGQPAGGPNCAGGMACPEFRLTSVPTVPASPGLRIAPAAAPVSIQVRYSPIDTGADTGAIAVAALQDGQPITYLIGLQARSDNTGIQTDTFVQDQRPKADVLLTIDDSGSMGDKQNLLAQNFSSFIQFATAAQVDYQIAVTSTTLANKQVCAPIFGCVNLASSAPGGRFRRIAASGTRPAIGPILTPSTMNLANAFGDLVTVGINGDGEEMGLETTVLALTPPLSAGDNAGFLRDDANLAVVVVTDAEDQSPQPISYYQNRLINVKGFSRLSMFTFNNIGPYQSPAPTGSCSYDGNTAPNRYRTLVTATGGIQAEICSNNWAMTLQQLGQTAFGARTQFFLNNIPDTAGPPLDVKVNGMSLPAGSWSYDSATNSIKFSMSSRPQAGQSLTVTYPIACL